VQHPELRSAHSIFRALATELTQHLDTEERDVFPMIRALDTAQRERRAVPAFPSGSITNPIIAMEGEHHEVRDALRALRRLTHEFSPPADACPSYRALLDGLERVEQDLHLHIHKENNVLFRRAAKVESQLSGAPVKSSHHAHRR
jgi:regulator of cell morphogenesis and NO signaling